MLETILPIVWLGFLALGILIYVILDGFDLGVGILFPFIKQEKNRNIMMNTIIPVWDGNATWLVMGGACLYGAFPMVYSNLLPTLYMPIMLMLFALIFRGLSFEFRAKAVKSKIIWDTCFFLGSTLAAFTQGLILGTFIQGFHFTNGVLVSDAAHWWSPFSIMTGTALIFGYALLGATWLIVKTTGHIQNKMYRYAKILLFVLGGYIAAVSLWTPFVDPIVIERWFSVPNVFFLAPLPLATAIVGFATLVALQKRRELAPFLLSITLFLLAFAGLAISIWPYIIPHTVTIWEAAAPMKSQLFFLVGVVLLVPPLLIYTSYVYRVFAGKVTEEGSLY